jgi:hypothetical protein
MVIGIVSRMYLARMISGLTGIILKTAFDCENEVLGYCTQRTCCSDCAIRALGWMFSLKSICGGITLSNTGVAAI